MNRFFIGGNRPEEKFEINIEDKDQVRHIVSSLRLGKGDRLELCFDDSLECIAEIISVSDFEIKLVNCENCQIARELPSQITLFQGIPKLKKMDFIVQKAVECGVHSITPVNMNNCVAIMRGEKRGKKIERLQKIALAAAEQCKRSYIPKVNDSVESKNILKQLENFDLVILADEGLSKLNNVEKALRIKDFDDKIRKSKKIAIIVGPEGGLSQEERDLLRDRAISVGLGSRILRTETVAIFILAQLSYILN